MKILIYCLVTIQTIKIIKYKLFAVGMNVVIRVLFVKNVNLNFTANVTLYMSKISPT